MFLPKKCRIVQFADDNLPTHSLPKKTLFSTFLYYQQLNHDLPNYDLPTYNLPKCHFNDANVVFTTCNDRQYWSKRTSKGLRPKRALSNSPAKRPASLRCFLQIAQKNNKMLKFFFSANCDSGNCQRQIMCQQIVIWHIALWQIASHPMNHITLKF